MSNFIDMTGRRFGRLVVLERAGSDAHGKPTWLCRCDCGRETTVDGTSLRRGRTMSCGCYQREIVSRANKTHGMRGTRLYRVWAGMKTRVMNENAPNFKFYGGRGISVCDEWLEFEPFQSWALANGYTDSLTIDRINVNGDYEPGNCRWVTKAQQHNNMRSNRIITFMGEAYTLTEWSKLLGINRATLHGRLQRLPPEEAFLMPPPSPRSRKTKAA